MLNVFFHKIWAVFHSQVELWISAPTGVTCQPTACPEKHAATAAPHRDTLALGAGEFGASVAKGRRGNFAPHVSCRWKGVILMPEISRNHGLFFFFFGGGMWCIFFGLKDGYFTHMVGWVFQMCLGTYKGNETTELLIGLPVLRLRHGWRDLWLNRKNHLKPFEVLCCKALNLFEGLRTLYHRVHRHSEEPLKSFVPVLFCKHLCEQI